MDIRVLALRTVTLCAVHFGSKILNHTIKELERMSSHHERKKKRKHQKPVFRVLIGGRK